MPRTSTASQKLAKLIEDEKPKCCALTLKDKPCQNFIVRNKATGEWTFYCATHKGHDGKSVKSRIHDAKAFHQKVAQLEALKLAQEEDADITTLSPEQLLDVKKTLPQAPSASKVVSVNTKNSNNSDSEGDDSDSESVQEASTSKAPKPAKLDNMDPKLLTQFQEFMRFKKLVKA
jgi:hypothetical protein